MKVLIVSSLLLACAAAQLLVSPYSVSPLHFQPHIVSPNLVTSRWVATPQILAAAQPAPIIAPAVQTIRVPTSSQYHAQDELGQFAFGHQGDNQAREEVKAFDGSVRGAYSYVDPNGKLINVQYLADDNGFRVLGANNLPVAPAVPVPVELKGPDQVQDTPEVIYARAEFAKKFEEAKVAAEAAPETPEEKPAEEIKSRRRRAILLSSPLLTTFSARSLITPSLITSPVLPIAKTTLKTAEFKSIEAPTPADTKKADIVEKEHEIISPVITTLDARSFIASPVLAPTIPLAKTTITTHELKSIDAPTPADTKSVEIEKKEHEVISPLGSWILPASRAYTTAGTLPLSFHSYPTFYF